MNELIKALLEKYPSCKRISRGTGVSDGMSSVFFDINSPEALNAKRMLSITLADDILEDNLVKFEKTHFKDVGYLIMGCYIVSTDTLHSMINDAYAAGLKDANR